jgi:hypothetical protein
MITTRQERSTRAQNPAYETAEEDRVIAAVLRALALGRPPRKVRAPQGRVLA